MVLFGVEIALELRLAKQAGGNEALFVVTALARCGMHLHREIQRLEIGDTGVDERRNAVVHAPLHVVKGGCVVFKLGAVGIDVAVLIARVKVCRQHPAKLQRSPLLVAASALGIEHRENVLAVLAARRRFFFELK